MTRDEQIEKAIATIEATMNNDMCEMPGYSQLSSAAWAVAYECYRITKENAALRSRVERLETVLGEVVKYGEFGSLLLSTYAAACQVLDEPYLEARNKE